jgi:hypothetical protein
MDTNGNILPEKLKIAWLFRNYKKGLCQIARSVILAQTFLLPRKYF